MPLKNWRNYDLGSEIMDYELLLRLVNDVPDDLDKTGKKEKLPKKMREEISNRDGMKCQICGRIGEYGSKNPYLYGSAAYDGKLQVHYIIPNGNGTPDNLVLLCKYCHSAVHNLLYSAGKWRYVNIR